MIRNGTAAISPKALPAFGHDLAASAAAWVVAYWLRFNLELPEPYFTSMLETLWWVVPLQGASYWAIGLYRGMWRYASLPDLKQLALAVATAATVVPAMLIMFHVDAIVPRSVLLIDPILLMCFMGGGRLAYRAWKERTVAGLTTSERELVLVLGAGSAAAGLLREVSLGGRWRVVGLLDDNPDKIGRSLHGVQVLGPIGDAPAVAKRLQVGQAIIAMPSAPHASRRRALEMCREAGLQAFTVPSFNDLMSGKVTFSQVRAVELDDLLGRDPVTLDDAGLHGLLSGGIVMVTGAGGSIGAELARQIAGFGPARIVMFDHSEYALYRIEQEFSERFPATPADYCVGDVRNPDRVREVLDLYRPTLVFHAAAYKHVPLMENGNAWEAVQNNTVGTWNVARLARELGVTKFILVSTDKAVRPANVMGASKRLAEMVCQHLQGSGATRFVIVRFGNVLGSTGSVIPKFHEQIARGGPITVTHPEVTRYFMSISEAAQLVLQAGLMGKGGEIFVLEMGEPVKIADLAREMIHLSGMSEQDIRIVFTGLRPGEKLFEEPLAADENTLPTPHPKLRIAQARCTEPGWFDPFLAWARQPRPLTESEVKETLRKWLPEYRGGS